MDEVRSSEALRQALSPARREGRTIGLVPTMGYLHEGHLRLVRQARRENDLVVMSIYVNPTQFGPGEDFSRYPRDVEHDRARATEEGVDILFLPDTDAMYPGGTAQQLVWVDPGGLADYLCGASRPGHFRGVATVVAKLFNFVQPDSAYFGQKDAQQAVIIKRMARDLAFPIDVRMVPTVREHDGLAMSSRNVYLTDVEREQAATLYAALRAACRTVAGGEREASRLESIARAVLTDGAPAGRVDYVTVAGLADLQPVRGRLEQDAVIALAVYFGATRLIDNVIIRFVDGEPHCSQ